MTEVQTQCTMELPAGFDENRIVLLARDPHWLYAYWDVSEELKTGFIREFGQERWDHSTPVLKITNVSNNTSFYIRINDFSTNWYIHVADSNALYTAELGRKFSDHFFVQMVSSNYTATPSETTSTNTSRIFMDYRDIREGKSIPQGDEIYETYDIQVHPKSIFGFGSQELFGVNSNEAFSGISSECLLVRKDVSDDNR